MVEESASQGKEVTGGRREKGEEKKDLYCSCCYLEKNNKKGEKKESSSGGGGFSPSPLRPIQTLQREERVFSKPFHSKSSTG